MIEGAADLIVESDTGVEVSLAVAGPGARAYAFVIDWHIRLLLALAWFVVSAVIVNGKFSLTPPAGHPARWFGGVVAPTLGLYFLYHYVLELLMHGRTPGKRMAGVRIVARDGATSSSGALLTRNVFRVIDCLPVGYCVGLVAICLTREHVRIGDMAAGTLLVYEKSSTLLPALPQPGSAAGRLDPAATEIIGELLERWPSLEPQARAALAQQALARYGTAAPASAGSTDEKALHAQLEELLRGVRWPTSET